MKFFAPTWTRASEQGERWNQQENWRETDAALRSLAKRRAALDAEEAEWLLKAREQQIHMYLGLATFQEYVERVLGHGPRAAQERIRVAETLANQPALKDALASGRLPFTAVRELSRVTLPGTQLAWIEAAAGKTLRQVERMVSGRKPGDLPETPSDPALVQHTLHFEVSAQTAALFREALRKIRQDAGTHLITVCATCKKTGMHGGGEPVEVGPEVLEKAMCDALEIGRIDQGDPERAAHSIPPAVRRLVWHRDQGRCIVPGCRSRIHLEVHHIRFREHGGGHQPANLGVLCGGCHDRVHAGTLVIRGSAPDGLTFLHGDGRPLGAPPPEIAVSQRNVFADAISALVNLQFSKGAARTAVEVVRVHVGATPAVEDVVRLALRQLRQR